MYTAAREVSSHRPWQRHYVTGSGRALWQRITSDRRTASKEPTSTISDVSFSVFICSDADNGSKAKFTLVKLNGSSINITTQ